MQSTLEKLSCNMNPPPPATYYIHPRVQRYSRYNSFKNDPYEKVTSPRQTFFLDQVRSFIQTNSSPMKVVDGYIVSDSRWEATWDGLHYSLLGLRSGLLDPPLYGTDVFSYTVNDTNALFMNYKPSGRSNVCKTIGQFPYTHNVCHNGVMYWMNRVIDSNSKFDSFEGGVSRMLTMIWLNTMCDSS
jgi:hypothetical protein